MKRVLPLFLLVFLFCGEADTLPNDIRWVRNAAEYDTICQQTYRMAWDQLKDAVKNSSDDAVIVMDLDETVLDNSLYQVKLAERGESFTPESWDVWVTRAEAGRVPGVKAFLDSVHAYDKVSIVFISNRMVDRTRETIINMKKQDIYDSDDIFLLRADSDDRKPVRRAEVIQGTGRMAEHGPATVLGYFGDQLGDFPEDADGAYLFGVNQFIFPNPMYGKW